MTFTIDGRTFDPGRDDQTVALGTTEEWTVVNTSPMDHPFHQTDHSAMGRPPDHLPGIESRPNPVPTRPAGPRRLTGSVKVAIPLHLVWVYALLRRRGEDMSARGQDSTHPVWPGHCDGEKGDIDRDAEHQPGVPEEDEQDHREQTGHDSEGGPRRR